MNGHVFSFLSFCYFSLFLIWYFKSILQSVLHSSIVEGLLIDPSTGDSTYHDHDVTNYFLVASCIFVIAASEKATDTVWFVEIFERREADQPYTDDYGLLAAKGREFFSEKYLEWASKTRHKAYFQQMKKTMFYCKISRVYPLVYFKYK